MRASLGVVVVSMVFGLAACSSEDSPYGNDVNGPLELLSSSPANGAQAFDSSKPIVLEFNRAVDAETLEIVLEAGGTAVPVEPLVDEDVVEVTASLEFDTDYVLRIQKAEDQFGNALKDAPVAISFRTAVDGEVKVTLADVQPIFTRSCVDGCHGGRNPDSGLTLEAGRTFHQLVNARGTTFCPPSTRTRVVPGDPDASCLWALVKSGSMPKDGRLSETDKETIRQWIADGALE